MSRQRRGEQEWGWCDNGNEVDDCIDLGLQPGFHGCYCVVVVCIVFLVCASLSVHLLFVTKNLHLLTRSTWHDTTALFQQNIYFLSYQAKGSGFHYYKSPQEVNKIILKSFQVRVQLYAALGTVWWHSLTTATISLLWSVCVYFQPVPTIKALIYKQSASTTHSQIAPSINTYIGTS